MGREMAPCDSLPQKKPSTSVPAALQRGNLTTVLGAGSAWPLIKPHHVPGPCGSAGADAVCALLTAPRTPSLVNADADATVHNGCRGY
jgi:hypothetical protein